MTEEHSEPQDQASVATEEVEAQTQEVEQPQEQVEEKTVPVSAIQKERKKRQQLQQELEQLKQQQQPQEEDYSQYESVTKQELGQTLFEVKRDVREEEWATKNQERANYVNENLEEFLKQRPNLAYAIANSPNRLKDAWDLMEGLAPKKVQKPQVQKDVPKAPGTVPKSAALNDAVDVMNMSDKEFREWRASKRRR